MALLGDTLLPRVHACEGGFAVEVADEDGDPYAIVRLSEA